VSVSIHAGPLLVTGNCSSQDLSLLYGRGDGTFDAEQRMGLSARAGDIVIADLDEDGYQDLLVSKVDIAGLTVFWGTGGRGFTAADSLPSPAGPFRLRAADLDTDGHLDLLILADFAVGVTVLWGDGTRAPSSTSTLPLPYPPNFLEIGDLNLDGKTDLAVTALCTAGEVDVILGNGSRQLPTAFPAFTVAGTALCEMAIGLLDRDGVPDIAVLDFSGRVAIGLGAGDGSFSLAALAPVGNTPASVTVADFDRDGLGDVAVSDSRDVTLLKGGSFEPIKVLSLLSCPDIILGADWNNDDRTDLLVINGCGHEVALFPNTSITHSATVQFVPASLQQTVGDQEIRAILDLPATVASRLDPSSIRLAWDDRSLGIADGVVSEDSAQHRVTVRFESRLLDMVTPGLQQLTVVGCDTASAAFSATAAFRVYAERAKTIWQASPPGFMPVRVHVSDQLRGRSELEILDATGRLIVSRSLISDPENLVAWDGRNRAGGRVPAGVYFARFRNQEVTGSCKIVIVR
jgi:hypothetical protein